MNFDDQFFQPGQNSWRIARAERASVLYNGAEYFQAFYEACSQAKSHIYIAGWDFQSEIELLRGTEGQHEYPTKLKPFLNTLATKKGIQVYMLAWDFAMFYALERDWVTPYQFNWKTHKRFHFCADSQHPPTASQHQKLVVVDDIMAFVGGIDLTTRRWDTREHRANDGRRKTPGGVSYQPFHDLQWAVDGDAAVDLSDLFQHRWKNATGNEISCDKQDENNKESIWPESVEPAFKDIDIALSRTYPEFNDQQQAREIERLYLDAIPAASSWIYIENQYLTCQSVTEALCSLLSQDSGPEVVIVLPAYSGGWLEQSTMDVVRARCVRQLRDADKHDRLRIYFPVDTELKESYIIVHSKMMAADGRYLSIGTANLSNRSMALDSECNGAIVAQSQTHEDRILNVVFTQISQLTGQSVEEVASIYEQTRSIIATCEQCGTKTKYLEKLDVSAAEEISDVMPDSKWIDFEDPVTGERLMQEFIDEEERPAIKHRALLASLVLLTVLAIAGVWRLTPLADLVDMALIKNLLFDIRQSAFTLPLMLAAFVTAGLVAFPISILIAATLVIFDPIYGYTLSLLGGTLGAVAGFFVGKFAGQKWATKWFAEKFGGLSEKLKRHSTLAIVFLRIVPVAPFTAVNIMAGASGISKRSFIIGTLIGLTPGVAGLGVITHQALAFAENPGWGNFGMLVGIILSVVAIFTAAYRLLQKIERRLQ